MSERTENNVEPMSLDDVDKMAMEVPRELLNGCLSDEEIAAYESLLAQRLPRDEDDDTFGIKDVRRLVAAIRVAKLKEEVAITAARMATDKAYLRYEETKDLRAEVARLTKERDGLRQAALLATSSLRDLGARVDAAMGEVARLKQERDEAITERDKARAEVEEIGEYYLD